MYRKTSCLLGQWTVSYSKTILCSRQSYIMLCGNSRDDITIHNIVFIFFFFKRAQSTCSCRLKFLHNMVNTDVLGNALWERLRRRYIITSFPPRTEPALGLADLARGSEIVLPFIVSSQINMRHRYLMPGSSQYDSKTYNTYVTASLCLCLCLVV